MADSEMNKTTADSQIANPSSSTTSDANTYFAAREPEKVANALLSKVADWTNSIESNGYLEKLRSSYAAYHGAYFSDTGSGHQITFSGEQGELVNLAVNHYRNIAQHILVMTTSNRPSMEARATNTDYKSQVQTLLANNILEYYMREKRLEVHLKRACEDSIVFGSGYIKMEWDENKGELVDYIEETKTKIYDGDITFENRSPFDIVMDNTKETSKGDWVCVRSWKNKFDLAAKYPEMKEKILKLPSKDEMNRFRLGLTSLFGHTDDVQIIEFYHMRTESMPDGRYMLFCDDDVILQDIAMPYRILPVFRIAPSDILGTPFGYTPMFDLLPLQEAMNTTWSTVMTNQNAFGVQNILNPRGSDIAINQLVGGLNVIDYNPAEKGGGKPEPLNLTDTPQEIFKFADMLERTMETLSGVNSVTRGNPEASLKSGTSLALVESMALQFMSGLQESYVELVEDVGSAIIKLLQDFARSPRLVAIAGIKNRSYMKEFSGDDISGISRVVVDVGNPMARTTAGRVQMAQELIQYGQITPRQYVNIIHTGSLDDVTEQIEHENLLIRAENESLLNGEVPQVIATESHKEHIDAHKGVLSDPDLKKDAALVKRVLDHIQEHIQALQQTDPALLMLLGQQPLPPPPPPGGAPQAGPMPGQPMPPNAGAAQPMQPRGPSPSMQKAVQKENTPPQGVQGQNGVIQGGRVAGPSIPQGVRIPSPAQPPKSIRGQVPSPAVPNPR